MENPYLALTAELNAGRLRAIVSSGQAVVLHRLAIMSKDGDWILREDQETCDHALSVLARHRSRYRFGAPLDPRWLAGGWSSHLEHRSNRLRLRTDFVSRPPRLSAKELEALWESAARHDPPVVDLVALARIKETNREKDYAVIGELARLMVEPRAQLRYSRSARDLQGLAEQHPELTRELATDRAVLQVIRDGRDAIERALDAERRVLMRKNEERLARYDKAARPWAERWPEVRASIEDKPLMVAHQIMAERALGVLPFSPTTAS